jgi:hypothetical protein
MSRRAVIGKQNDGSYGLRCSLPGIDAFVGDGLGGGFTFNSDWADIAKVHAIGVTTWQANAWEVTPGSGIFLSGFTAAWTSQGFIPFAEVRRLISGVVINDDRWTSTMQFGNYTQIHADKFRAPDSSTSDQVLYLVYKIATGNLPA